MGKIQIQISIMENKKVSIKGPISDEDEMWLKMIKYPLVGGRPFLASARVSWISKKEKVVMASPKNKHAPLSV